jgi:hypothetical protein
MTVMAILLINSEGCRAGFDLDTELTAVEQFAFQRGEEALAHPLSK